mmetsp:Transcript_39268/g.100640  ORF Transcript_39268/g.100640 Transcript_39268/m.100640 type:complete len:373 (-) Transcript_39268:1701-2819(-)
MRRTMHNSDGGKREPSQVSGKGGGESASRVSPRLTIGVVHINITLYALCFWISQPVLPYLAEELGADSRTFGYLQTAFSAVQLVGGIAYGRLGDSAGGRFTFVLAFLGSFVSYAMLAVSDSVWLLFLSRVPSLVQHAYQGASMIVADVSPPENRAKALGRISLSYGVGMIIGPSIGGYLSSTYSFSTIAWIAACLSLVSAVSSYLLLPASLKKKASPKKPSLDISSAFSIVKRHRYVGTLLSIKACVAVAVSLFRSTFPVHAKDNLHFTAQESGYFMSYIGIITAVVQSFIVGEVVSRLKPNQVLQASVFGLAASYLCLALVDDRVGVMICTLPMVTFGAILTTFISSELTKSVDEGETGTVLGLDMVRFTL